MVFTLGTLFEAALLLVNAIAILNEERFLAKGKKVWESSMRRGTGVCTSYLRVSVVWGKVAPCVSGMS